MLNNITVSIKLKNNNLVLCIDVMKTLNFPNKTSFISTINFKKGERFKLNSNKYETKKIKLNYFIFFFIQN